MTPLPLAGQPPGLDSSDAHLDWLYDRGRFNELRAALEMRRAADALGRFFAAVGGVTAAMDATGRAFETTMSSFAAGFRDFFDARFRPVAQQIADGLRDGFLTLDAPLAADPPLAATREPSTPRAGDP